MCHIRPADYAGFLAGRLVAVPVSTHISPLSLLSLGFGAGAVALVPLLPGLGLPPPTVPLLVAASAAVGAEPPARTRWLARRECS